MTPENKLVWRTVAFTAGIAILIGITIYLVIRNRDKGQQQNEDYSPSAPSKKPASPTSGSSGSNFTTDEVKRMQSYLYVYGAMALNSTITDSIKDSKGIDGVIGSGFRTALAEAIKIGIVDSQQDLYYKSKNFGIITI